MRVDMQYVACVSHVRAATTKGDSPLEEMSILGRCRNNSLSNAVGRIIVGRSLPPFRAAHELLLS